MEELIKQAMKALQENPLVNEVELADGINKVRVVRNAPAIYCTWPWTYTYQPNYTGY